MIVWASAYVQGHSKGAGSRSRSVRLTDRSGANEVPIRTRESARAQASGGPQVTGESQNRKWGSRLAFGTNCSSGHESGRRVVASRPPFAVNFSNQGYSGCMGGTPTYL